MPWPARSRRVLWCQRGGEGSEGRDFLPSLGLAFGYYPQSMGNVRNPGPQERHPLKHRRGRRLILFFRFGRGRRGARDQHHPGAVETFFHVDHEEISAAEPEGIYLQPPGMIRRSGPVFGLRNYLEAAAFHVDLGIGAAIVQGGGTVRLAGP